MFSILSIVLLVVGFGFVIFWHELGHFLAAKWVGIRVEQFAVGMGHAVFSYRKGIGWTWGSTQKEYLRRAKELLDKRSGAPKKDEDYSDREIFAAADELGLGQTEYRIAWFPIGGYVKPYGQDDLDLTSRRDEPSSYSSKTVGQRMLVISAGVIMNVILAGILFMVLFMMGFRAPAPVVGTLLPGSPAQMAGVQVGDELVSYNGKPMHDFTKLMLETALSAPNEPVELVVKRAVTGEVLNLTIRPQKPSPDAKSFVSIGVERPTALVGPKLPYASAADPNIESAGYRALAMGDTIIAVNGQSVTPDQFYVFDRALQLSTPEKPVALSVRDSAGKVRTVPAAPRMLDIFGTTRFQLAGMEPRMRIAAVRPGSPIYGKLKPNDIILQVTVRANEPEVHRNLSITRFMELMNKAGGAGQSVDVVALRDGSEVKVEDVKPIKVAAKQYGLGVAPAFADQQATIATVARESAAARAGIPEGATITAVDDQAVKSWFDFHQALRGSRALAHKVRYTDAAGKEGSGTLDLDAIAMQDIQAARYTSDVALLLDEQIRVRQTSNPIEALSWGVTETRDLILQFYVTIRRMVAGDVSPSNLMGPVGIFRAGASFAFRGTDWLIWFLAMISANLAVVNFLPIPIVDGGHFLFLLIEKVSGRPPSRRVLEVAQMAGLVFILGVFLFVTYNDIARIAGWH